jgi:hypothetical protein
MRRLSHTQLGSNTKLVEMRRTLKRGKVDEMLDWRWDEDAIEASDRLKPSVRLDMAHEAELVSHRTYAVKYAMPLGYWNNRAETNGCKKQSMQRRRQEDGVYGEGAVVPKESFEVGTYDWRSHREVLRSHATS